MFLHVLLDRHIDENPFYNFLNLEPNYVWKHIILFFVQSLINHYSSPFQITYQEHCIHEMWVAMIQHTCINLHLCYIIHSCMCVYVCVYVMYICVCMYTYNLISKCQILRESSKYSVEYLKWGFIPLFTNIIVISVPIMPQTFGSNERDC